MFKGMKSGWQISATTGEYIFDKGGYLKKNQIELPEMKNKLELTEWL